MRFYGSQLRRLLIFVICQRLLCYGDGAVRTLETTTPVAAEATPPFVSASEATLLTTPLFDGSALDINEIATEAEVTDLPAETIYSNGYDNRKNNNNKKHNKLLKHRYKIIALHTNCTRDLFEMRLDLNRPFHGLLYAMDFPFECRSRGTMEKNITLRLPTSGCGVRVEPRNDGTMELSVRVMLQIEPKLRQSSDLLRTVRCKLPLSAMGLTLAMRDPKLRQGLRNGRMHVFHQGATIAHKANTTRPTFTKPKSNDSSVEMANNQHHHHHQYHHQQQQHQSNTHMSSSSSSSSSSSPSLSPSSSSSSSSSSTSSSTPRVRIWLELGGPDGSGAVVVGQATTLTVRAIVPGTIGVRVVDCAALDGLGESTQQLLDERGCPIDEQVMPALHTRIKPLEEGWSKQQEDDLVEKMFTATFAAFKFPDRERLHVSCGVQLCKGHCPDINCRTAEKLLLSTEEHLARIEVFNSLAVTAPQIEVDRLRYDHRYNMSVEEYPPYVRTLSTGGTLCLSLSKLALSFCVLGLVFLVAVIVSVYSLIRTRKRIGPHSAHDARLHRAEACTSMFSSSSDSAQSALFGSKLFVPYYPNTLPYGRVY